MVETSCNGMMNGDSDKNDNSKVPANIQDEQTMTPKGESIAAKAKRAKEKLEMKRERKAARTLGIITGAYIGMCNCPTDLSYTVPSVLENFLHPSNQTMAELK
jgi:hypothetical protein